jgi:hypothetical protein
MTETDISKVLIEGDYATIMGVKYKRVEPLKMTFELGGKFEIVSYNDKKYYRLEYNGDDESHTWYRGKYDLADGMMLVQIDDRETRRLLEGIWFNEVKKGKYDEPDCPDEPYRNVRAYWDEKDNPKPNTLQYLIVEWLENTEDGTSLLMDRIEEWLPKEQSAAGSQNAYVECSVEGFNDCLTKIKGKLR